jgi:DNA polymerase-3 subunit beta
MILLKANRDVLLKPIQQIAGIVERRHTLPILSNILIQKTGSLISFIATDIEIQISAALTNETNNEDAALTVSARKFLDILRALPTNDELTLSLQNNNRLIIQQGRSKFSLQTLNADEFPTISAQKDIRKQLRITEGQLKNVINLTAFAMAQQDIRYYLNGMLFVFEPRVMRSVTTDGHRLAYAQCEINAQEEQTDSAIEVIIPRKAINELQKILEDSDTEIDISVGTTQIAFSFRNIKIISKLIEGKFPDYQRVVPTKHSKHIIINRELLGGALQRAAILTTDKFKGVRIILSADMLRISSTNAEQEEAQEDLAVSYTGEPLDIGFNVQYLIDVLTNIKVTDVKLSLEDQNSSALMSSEAIENYRYVVMPMRI